MREIPELSSGVDKSGSTAVCAFISPKQIYVGNCGDSRAVLSRDGVPVFYTMDHKPVLPGIQLFKLKLFRIFYEIN